MYCIVYLLAICHPSGCTVASGVVGVVVVVGVCNRSQMRTTKYTFLIFNFCISDFIPRFIFIAESTFICTNKYY